MAEVTCFACKGRGITQTACRECGGSGKDRRDPRKACGGCFGNGQVDRNCTQCGGSGRIYKK